MKPNQLLVTILCTVAISSGVFVGSTSSTQACPLSASTAGQTPQIPNSTPSTLTTGIALLGGLLAVGGAYWFRRQSDSSRSEEASYESELPSAPVIEQVSERELVGSRK